MDTNPTDYKRNKWYRKINFGFFDYTKYNANFHSLSNLIIKIFPNYVIFFHIFDSKRKK